MCCRVFRVELPRANSVEMGEVPARLLLKVGDFSYGCELDLRRDSFLPRVSSTEVPRTECFHSCRIILFFMYL